MSFIAPKKRMLKDGTPVTLRSARLDDTEKVLAYARNVFATSEYLLTEPDEFTPTIEQERAWIDGISGSDSKLLILAEKDAEIIGMMDIQAGHRRRIAHNGTLGMSIRRDFRGKGLGAYLLKAGVEWAERSGKILRLELSVFSENQNAIALYRKLGFQEEGRKQRAVRLPDGRYIDEILMALPLKG